MVFTVYPSENDVAQTVGEGRIGSEKTHTDYSEMWLGDHVKSGYDFPASTSGTLSMNVQPGVASIDGQRVESHAVEAIVLAANDTNHIYVKFTIDGSNNVISVALVSNVSGEDPIQSVKLGQAITNATEVTSTIPEDRSEDPYLFQDNHFYAETGKLAIVAAGFAILPSFSAGSSEIFVYVPRSAEFINIALNVFAGSGSPAGPAEVRLSVEGTNKTITGPSESVAHTVTQVVIVSAPIRDLKLFSPGRYLKVKVQGGQTVTSGQGAETNDDDTAFTGGAAGTTVPIDGIKFFSLTDRSDV